MTEIVVDTSEMEAPEPLRTILTEASLLEEGSYIKMIHRMEPCVLYENLDRMKLKYKTYKKSGGSVEIYIWEPNDTEEMKNCLPD